MGCTLGTRKKKKEVSGEEYEKATENEGSYKKLPANGHSNGHNAKGVAAAPENDGDAAKPGGEDVDDVTIENKVECNDVIKVEVSAPVKAEVPAPVKVNGDVIGGKEEPVAGDEGINTNINNSKEIAPPAALPAEESVVVVQKVETVMTSQKKVVETQRVETTVTSQGKTVVTESSSTVTTSTEGGEDPSQHGAQMEDRFYNNKSFQKPDIDPTDPQQQDAALAIQTKYRQFHAKQVVQDKRKEKAAVTIQAGYRGFHDRKELKEGGPAEEADQEETAPEETAPEKTEEEIDIDLNDPEVHVAATKIQAGFKGHKARKEVKAMKEDEPEVPAGETQTDVAAPPQTVAYASTAPEEEEVDIDLNDPEVGAAAVKIQAGFKGFKARKAAKETKEETDTTEKSEEVEKDTNEPELETQPETNEITQNAPEEEEIDIDLNDPEVAEAAVKIQAGFKGFKARKAQTPKDTSATPSAPAPSEPKPAPNPAEEEIDIDLTDPEVSKAAVMIQGKFKGLKAMRSRAKSSKSVTAEVKPSSPKPEPLKPDPVKSEPPKKKKVPTATLR